MILFFDTETTGKVKKGGWQQMPSPKNLALYPEVVQIAWVLFDEGGDLHEEHEFLCRREFREWTKEAERIHGISREMIEQSEKALPPESIYLHFWDSLQKSKNLVAHNIAFDYRVVLADLFRLGMVGNVPPVKVQKICTMKSTTDLLRLPTRWGKGYKYPKLEELHRFLFGEDFDGAHDALADVKATARCFFELKSRGLLAL